MNDTQDVILYALKNALMCVEESGYMPRSSYEVHAYEALKQALTVRECEIKQGKLCNGAVASIQSLAQ